MGRGPVLAQKSMAGLLAEIAAGHPTAGSGAAAATTLALGLACLRKAVAVSVRHAPDDGRLDGADLRLGALMEEALGCADGDTQGFAAMLAAERRGDAEERTRLSAELVALDERMDQLCARVRIEADALQAAIIGTMANDLLAARLLSDAAAGIARANREENGMAG
jgi:formiminotetrahydrofolate cyclodeaminase